MSLEEALQQHEEKVDALLKGASRYVNALKNWKKACQSGHIGNRQKAAASAEELVQQLTDPTTEAVGSWTFDARNYLEGDDWRTELQAACAAIGLRVFEEEETLVSPPVIVRSQPGLGRMIWGKTGWPTLHPKVTAAHLKKLNDKSFSAAASQQFLNALYDGCRKVSRQGDLYARFREIYDLFSFAPGWAKDNSPATFAQQIYALHRRSEVRTTRDGKTFEIEYPAGKPKDKDIFSVISDDGRPLRYYGIWFR